MAVATCHVAHLLVGDYGSGLGLGDSHTSSRSSSNPIFTFVAFRMMLDGIYGAT
jgi:hypothetical protein